MLVRLALTVLLVAALSACSSMSEVTPVAGKDMYSVTNSSGTQLITWVELKNQTLQRADAYCESLGRKMTHPKIASNHATGIGAKKAQVTFQCDERVVPDPKPE